jgi:ATP-dependent Clp protease protease subunit
MNIGNEFRKYAVKHKGISSIKVDAYMESTMEGMTRTVIEERPMNFREIDVFSRLMADRILFLGMPIDDYVANIVQAQLLFLDSMDARRDIQMYINSPGGSVYAGLGIYDTMQWVNPNVATSCLMPV